MNKIKLNNENELVFEKLNINLNLFASDQCNPGCDPNCAPSCDPGCDPRCCPICSPSCQPCFPFGKCNPDLGFD